MKSPVGICVLVMSSCVWVASAGASTSDGDEVRRVRAGSVVRIESTSRTEGHVELPAAFAPKGKYLAVVAADGTLAICETATGKCKSRLGRLAAADAAAFSPDGKRLVALMADSSVRLWNTDTGKTLSVLQKGGPVYSSATFSPDGKVLALVKRDRSIEIRDSSSGAVRFRISSSNHSDTAAAFSPDSKILATVDRKGALHLWDLASKSRLRAVAGFRRGGFSPDGRFLLAACLDNKVRVVELPSGKVRMNIAADSGITSAEFSPDGKTLITMNSDGMLRLWDPAKGQVRSKIQLADEGRLGIDLSSRSGVTASWSTSKAALAADLVVEK